MEKDPRSKIDSSGVRAALQVNLAQIDVMKARLLGRKAPSPTKDPIASTPLAGTAPPEPQSTVKGPQGPMSLALDELAGRSNPMFGEAQTPVPKKLAQDYAPKYVDAIRVAPAYVLSPGAALPPVGDLFAASPAAPSLPVSDPVPDPGWAKDRRFLTGFFLVEEAADQTAAKQPSSVNLEIYPTEIQESLLVDGLLSGFTGLSGEYVAAFLSEDAETGHRQLKFRVVAQGQIEPALQELTQRMLPICEYVAVIQRYTETRDCPRWGLVAQGLAGALRGLLQDWHVMVAQLEHQLHAGKLTLQALWYYVQPPSEAMHAVAALCARLSAQRLRGAALLDRLHEATVATQGNERVNALLCRLLRAAAAPYFLMLRRWVGAGQVADPCGEFLVQEDAGVKQGSLTPEGQSAFWQDRWTLRRVGGGGGAGGADAHASASPPDAIECPAFLAAHARCILDTGKYLNLIRLCNRPLPAADEGPLEFDERGRYAEALRRARAVAARAAMRLLREDERSVRSLEALRRYFLTAQGDLIAQLLDGAGDGGFGRPASAVPLAQLQSALAGAVAATSAAADPAARELRAALDTRSILNLLVAVTQSMAAAPGPGAGASPRKSALRAVTPGPIPAGDRAAAARQRTAREAFMLCYSVSWPLSIVAPEGCLAQYQMVFRHLFELKWVERELNRVWRLHQQTRALANTQSRLLLRRGGGGVMMAGSTSDRGSSSARRAARPASGAALARSCALCQLSTHFFRQYLLYITFEVLEPLWRAFQGHLAAVDGFDEALEQHRSFLRRVLKGCLLSRKVVLLRSLLALKDIALQFVKVSDKILGSLAEAGEKEAEDAFALQGRRGADGRGTDVSFRRERAERAARRRAALDATLSQPAFASAVNTLYKRCVEKVGEFRAHLADAHRAAMCDRADTREDVESLLNLQQRLDYNGFFPDIK